MSDIQARLKIRDDERKAAAYQKKQERDDRRTDDETSDHFSKECASRRARIEDLLQAATALPKNELPDHFECISKEMQALQKFVSDSATFLNSFDLRSSQQQITQLLQEIAAKQNQLLPKKFAFKGGRKMAPVAGGPEGTTTEPKELRQTTEMRQAEGRTDTRDVAAEQVGFRDQSNCCLTLDSISGQDVNLSKLTRCSLRLPETPSTLHMSELVGCTILCGPVSSSVFVDSCTDCTIVVACQQLRVHSTHNTVFYLYVTSRSIVEDCTRLRFAPFNWTYPDMGKHFEQAGISNRPNNWDKIDDFLWLSFKEASPNWTVLPEAERVTTWTDSRTGEET
ncbi:hypothetical protein EMCRGX_G011094 [Ephydatia muelleri]|eukprot:Em0006g1187a